MVIIFSTWGMIWSVEILSTTNCGIYCQYPCGLDIYCHDFDLFPYFILLLIWEWRKCQLSESPFDMTWAISFGDLYLFHGPYPVHYCIWLAISWLLWRSFTKLYKLSHYFPFKSSLQFYTSLLLVIWQKSHRIPMILS